MLLIPLTSFLVIAGIQVTTSIATASHLDSFAQHVRVGREVTALIHELQRERDRTAGMLASLSAPGGSPRNVAELAPDWTAVDRAAEALRAAVQPLLGDQSLAGKYRLAQAAIAQLPPIRAGTTDGWLRVNAAFDSYTRIIATLQQLLPTSLESGGGPGLASAVRGLFDFARTKELTAQIRGYLYIVCNETAFLPGQFEQVADVRAHAQSALASFRVDADPSQLAQFEDTVTGQAVSNAGRLMQTIIGNAGSADLGVDPQQWWQASTTQLELMRSVEQNLLESASGQVALASRQQWQSTLLGSLTTLALLAVTVAASTFIGRIIAAALRSLREQALEVAQQRLPSVIEQLRASPTSAPALRVDPIVVRGRDEVGEVAEAFTAVHRSAVRLAAEQAHMRRNVNDILIKLARRSQALVERQLRLLDTMESSETNPDQLANLFRLDHLATRLRRNDENLLVLAEGDTRRRSDQPVELNTVVLAATAEIEQYQRVHHEVKDTIYIVAYAVTDLIHLIAELLENATTFSNPNTEVSLLARAAVNGGAELVIADRGIGMPPGAIAESNQQLAAPVSIDVSAAERMGLVVVGHLAKRYGIRIVLASGGPDDPGVSALITIPVNLVAAAPDDAPPPAQQARWVRTEDVLRVRRKTADSVWWSREVPPAAAAAAPLAGPPQPSISATLTSAGLPKRTRTKTGTVVAVEPAGGPPFQTDVEATESLLSSLYAGVRRADTETSKG